MTDSLNDFEANFLELRDQYVENHNKKVDKAKEQHGARNVSEKKILLPQSSQAKAKPKKHIPNVNKTGYLIRLGVRVKRLAPDVLFEYTSYKLSQLEAKIEAKKAAKEAGYPIIGYIYSIEKLDA